MVACIKISLLSAYFIGKVMVTVGVVFLVLVFPKMIDEKIGEALPIKNGTETMDRFISSPVPTYMSFYIFNVTNKDDVNNVNGTKPKLDQLGPYVFRQEKEKNILDIDEKAGTITYNEKTTYFFEAAMSKGTLEDSVNYVDAVAIVASTLLSMFGVKFPVLITTNSVDELLFTGVDLKPLIPEPLHPFVCGDMIPGCRFGFYFGKNESTSHQYTVSSGELSLKNIGEIYTYKGGKELNFWTGESCNALNGSDGKQFPPDVDKDKDLYVFSSDICRSLRIKYDDDVTHQGIDALRYVVPPEVFADPNKDKNNMCFCGDYAVDDTCPSKAGVIPLVKCLKEKALDPDKPVFASSPHFYLGEQEYVDKFEGLKPEKQKHQTYLDIEPLTGTMISAAKRIQINLLVLPDPNNQNKPFLQFVDSPFYFPVFWAEEAGVIDEKTAKEFRDKVTNPYRTGKWSLIAVIIVGAVLLLVSIVGALLKISRPRGRKLDTSMTSKLGYQNKAFVTSPSNGTIKRIDLY